MRSAGPLVGVVAAVAASLGPAPLAAQSAPAVVAPVAAFNATCRRGFPDLDQVARLAAQDGWQETSMRPIGSPPAALAGALPRVFRKEGLMLFLTRPNGGEFKRLCQVTGASAADAAGADVVAALAPTISDLEPRLEKDRTRDGAVWTFPNKIEIEAGTVRAGRGWSVSLVSRERN